LDNYKFDENTANIVSKILILNSDISELNKQHIALFKTLGVPIKKQVSKFDKTYVVMSFRIGICATMLAK
jgi:hypothetical protein